MINIDINPQFEQVLNFINHTNQPVFLTGKAGTGKTTLLKYLKQNTFKQLAIVAPTGVAAINAGGSTIHSFFQFPFTPFLPFLKEDNEIDYTKNNLPTLKYNAQRLAIFRNLELLIIDEISMVRADLLEQIDITLRQTRKKWHQAFGGVQVLLIGDMYQLPPVVQPDEWGLLSKLYASPYFFESRVIKNSRIAYIELDKIYRQNEETFIGLLNKVRNNQLDEQSLQQLNARYKANISQQDYADNITLTTHNRKADEINTRNLETLPGKEFRYKCKTEGVFSDRNFPADEELVLKKGTRVMFLKNNAEKNYYNGKIGVVTFLDKDKIKVKCDEDATEIEVGQETWTNVSFTLNKNTKHIEEDILGTFVQYPLRLAWAITIHKSQGLTFERLIIDAAESFSAGQVYVALSRCRSLQGITFSSLISAKSLMNDNNILNFATTRPSHDELNSIYKTARTNYLQNTLNNLFDFSSELNLRSELGGLLQLHKPRLNSDGIAWLTQVFDALDALSEVATRFKSQLNTLMQAASDIESDAALNLRVKQASSYFEAETNKLLSLLKKCVLVTESKETAEEFNPLMQQVFESVFQKHQLLHSCISGFNFNTYIKQKLAIRYPDFKINIYASSKNIKVSADVKHPLLYRKLLLKRDEICNNEHMPIYLVAANKSLIELSNFLPTSQNHLLKISGFGKARAEAYGDEFLPIIREYMLEHELESNMEALPVKKTKKSAGIKQQDTQNNADELKVKPANTRLQTLTLYQQGFSLNDIAKQRGLSITTIEGHLVPFIEAGEINIDALVVKQKQQLIETALMNFNPETGLNPIKTALPPEITFSEIKYVMAAVKTNSKNQTT